MQQSSDESMGQDGPTPLQQRFLSEYLVDFRPRAAAIRAGYAERNAAHSAWRLLQKPAIAKQVRTRQQILTDRLRLSADRVMWEHARIAFADMGRLVRFTRKGPRLRPRGEAGPNETAAVREVIRGRNGFHVRLYDKGRSLDMLTKMFGVVERFRAAQQQDTEDRAADDQFREKFFALVAAMRERLQIDPEVSPFEALAEGVARDDGEAIALAKQGRFMK
jgi:phage terminase small subunit